MTDPLIDTDLRIEPLMDSYGDRVKLIATKFPNDTAGTSGYRFRRWNEANADISTTPTIDSGWIQSNQYIDKGVTLGEVYTWALTLRNQASVESGTMIRVVEAPSPVYEPPPPLPAPQDQLTRMGDIIVPSFLSPIKRKAIRLKEIKLDRVTYAEESVFISTPYKFIEPIYQITMETEADVPSTYPVGNWLSFAIQLDGSNEEIPITPIGGPNHTTIVVNSLLSLQERELAQKAGWTFVDRDIEPSSLNVVIRISRPPNQPFTTPFVHNYTVYVKPRASLYTQTTERGPAPRAR
jgi:hypothetical protein